MDMIERVARVIDPEIWSDHDAPRIYGYENNRHQRLVQQSLEKARAVLALLEYKAEGAEGAL